MWTDVCATVSPGPLSHLRWSGQLVGGAAVLTLPPGVVVTLTTTTGQTKGGGGDLIPPPANFSLPFADDFER